MRSINSSTKSARQINGNLFKALIAVSVFLFGGVANAATLDPADFGYTVTDTTLHNGEYFAVFGRANSPTFDLEFFENGDDISIGTTGFNSTEATMYFTFPDDGSLIEADFSRALMIDMFNGISVLFDTFQVDDGSRMISGQALLMDVTFLTREITDPFLPEDFEGEARLELSFLSPVAPTPIPLGSGVWFMVASIGCLLAFRRRDWK